MVMSLPYSTFFWLFVPMGLLIVLSLLTLFTQIRKERMEKNSVLISENFKQVEKSANVRGS